MEKIHFKDIEHIIRETLDMGKTFKISPNGVSMLPLIVQGRDSVYIKRPEGRLNKYDIAFFKRDSGEFILHRVIKVKKDSYVFCGDNQWIVEKGIKDKNIIGVVCKLECDGKTILPDDADYMDYVKKRVGTRILKNYDKIIIRFIKICLHKIKKIILKKRL